MRKRYWLRGGIWFATIYIIMGFVAFLVNIIFLVVFIQLTVPIWQSIMFLYWDELSVYGILLTGAFGIVMYFLLGAISGWVYGKIKNRKKNQGQTFQS